MYINAKVHGGEDSGFFSFADGNELLVTIKMMTIYTSWVKLRKLMNIST